MKELLFEGGDGQKFGVHGPDAEDDIEFSMEDSGDLSMFHYLGREDSLKLAYHIINGYGVSANVKEKNGGNDDGGAAQGQVPDVAEGGGEAEGPGPGSSPS